MKKVLDKFAELPYIVFSDGWQNKFLSGLFGIMGLACFIAGFWNCAHFLLALMLWVLTCVAYNKPKE